MRRAAVVLSALLLAAPVSAQGERFTIEAHDVDLSDVVRLLAVRSGRNVVTDGSVKAQRVTLRLKDVDFDQVLSALATAYGLQVHREARIIIVGDAGSMNRRFADDLGGDATRTEVFSLHHAHPDELVPAIQSGLPPGTVVIPDKRTATLIVTGSNATIGRARQLLAVLDARGYGANGSIATESIPLRDLRASDAVKILRGVVPDGTLIADDRRNAVVVTGNDEQQTTIRTLLHDLDAPGRQVMIEVRVADVQPINDMTNVGVQLGGAGFGSGALGQFPYAVTKSAIVVNAQIDTLVQRGRASILAQPRIATLNNREASLLIGEQYPVVTVNQQTGFPSVQTIDVGVRLRLTPTIGADGAITAELHPEYSQIIGFNSSFPIIANRKVDATLRVRDGETIVLGGLFQDVDSETITKFPVLGDLPVLASFFRNRQSSHNKSEVVFFITPHVLNADVSEVPTRSP